MGFLTVNHDSKRLFHRAFNQPFWAGNYMSLIKYALFAVSFTLSSVTLAKDLRISIGTELPPYVFYQNSTGIEVEIIREALKVKGHTVSFYFVPNMLVQKSLKNREIDATVQNSKFVISEEANLTVYDSDTTVNYHNFAIAFDSQNFQIQSINDLVNKRVLAFQNASKYLGSDYAAMAEKNEDYREHPKQSVHVNDLYAGKIEVLISDKRIFNYWKSQAESKGRLYGNEMMKLKFHTIFEASARNVKFLERNTRDDFNDGLKFIKASGVYQSIIKKYESM